MPQSLQILSTNLTLRLGTSIYFSNSSLSTTDPITVPNRIYYSVADVQHGQFELISAPGKALLVFNQEQINNGQVLFKHDNTNNVPTYTLVATNGKDFSAPSKASLTLDLELKSDEFPLLQNYFYSTDEPGGPAITILKNGDIAMSYGTYGTSTYNNLSAQRFDKSGNKLGGEIIVSDKPLDQRYSSIAPLNNGGFVITWQSQLEDGDGDGIFAQIIDANSTKVGEQFQVNTYSAYNQQYPTVAVLNNGDFIIVWTGPAIDGSELYFYPRIYGQRFDIIGNKIGNEFLVSPATQVDQTYPRIAPLTSGGFVVVWESRVSGSSNGFVYAQLFDGTTNKVGSPITISTPSPLKPKPIHASSVAGLSGGGFVVIYTKNQDGSGWGIYGRQYAANGVPVTTEFRVNTYTTYDQLAPAVAAFSSGGYLVTWQSYFQDGSDYGIYGQRFNAKGVKVDSEFQVNTHITDKAQQLPTIASLPNDDAMIAWVSQGSRSIQARQVSGLHQQAPKLITNQLAIEKNQTVVLDSTYLQAEGYADELIFIPTDIMHGQFELVNNPDIAITQFNETQLLTSQVQFVHDGSNFIPHYSLRVFDGLFSSASLKVNVTSTLTPIKPAIITNQLNIYQGETAVITTNQLSALPAYSQEDDLLVFSIQDNQHGYFALVDNIQVPITCFTQALVKENYI